MKYLSKEQFAYRLNVNPKYFDSVEEISKYDLWFNKINIKKCEKCYLRGIGGFLKNWKSR